jgi:hypothetical protein
MFRSDLLKGFVTFLHPGSHFWDGTCRRQAYTSVREPRLDWPAVRAAAARTKLFFVHSSLSAAGCLGLWYNKRKNSAVLDIRKEEIRKYNLAKTLYPPPLGAPMHAVTDTSLKRPSVMYCPYSHVLYNFCCLQTSAYIKFFRDSEGFNVQYVA